jgi:hypothetical protein
MKTYNAEIDNGQGGDDTFQAETAAEALVLAIEWARKGDWPDEGCDINVSVVNAEDEDDTSEEDVHILSDEEKQNERLDEDGEILAEDAGEWLTDQVIRIGEDYYFRTQNGGSRGAYQNRSDSTELLTRAEARAKLLDMGLTPSEVASKTR